MASEAERRTPGEEQPEEESRVRRYLSLAAVIAAAVLVIYVLAFSGHEYKVTAEFENAAQLVGGEEVVVGGTRAGSVKEIELGPNGQALVTFTVGDEFAPLQRGTTATIRAGSLSSIAGRKLELTLPPSGEAGDEIEDGGVMTQSETVSEVDLDEVFNTLDTKTVKDFKRVIQGFEISYEGIGERANKGLKYFNPFLSTSRRLFSELSADDTALERLIVDTSNLSGALAARAPDISGLVGNLNQMMNAIGDRKERLAEAISLLPNFMREANTTFVNLRSALDDVDPLVEASKPAAVRLRPFMAELRAGARDAVPTIRDLQKIIKRRKPGNDLVELLRSQRPLTRSAIGSGSPDCGSEPTDNAELARAADGDRTQGAFGESVCALRNSMPHVSALRAYSPDIVGWFDGFSGHIGAIDALGGSARIAATFNAFTPSVNGLPVINILDLPGLLDTVLDEAGFEASLTKGAVARCPGSNERPLDGADPQSGIPFTDGGALTDGVPPDCDPSIVVPGP